MLLERITHTCGSAMNIPGPGLYECTFCGDELYWGPQLQVHCPKCGADTNLPGFEIPEDRVHGCRCPGCSNIFRRSKGAWVLISWGLGRFLGVAKVSSSTQPPHSQPSRSPEEEEELDDLEDLSGYLSSVEGDPWYDPSDD